MNITTGKAGRAKPEKPFFKMSNLLASKLLVDDTSRFELIAELIDLRWDSDASPITVSLSSY